MKNLKKEDRSRIVFQLTTIRGSSLNIVFKVSGYLTIILRLRLLRLLRLRVLLLQLLRRLAMLEL